MPVSINFIRQRTLSTDNDNDGQADPGDVFLHTIIIENLGDQDALNLVLSETENGYTIDPGSVKIGPIAFDNAFNITGNTPITFTVAQLLGNDVDPDGLESALVITSVGGAVNGTVTFNNNGTPLVFGDDTITFTPATGLDIGAQATFTYTIQDAQGLSSVANTPGVVTLTVTDVVWYVDKAYGGANGASDGSYLRPFTDLTQLNGLTGDGTLDDDVDSAGETIFIYDRAIGANDATGGIALEANQKLFGDAHAFVVNGITVGATTSNSTIDHAGIGITLATGNTIDGINLNGTALGAIGIADANGTVGAVTITNTNITGQGQIIDIDQGGTLTVTLTTAASTGSNTANGGVIDLAGVTGTFTVSGATSITGTHAQNAIDIGGAGTNLVTNFAGGTTIDVGTANGVNLTTNAGSTTFADIDVTTTSGAAFVASSAGTLAVTGTDNDITTQTGQILSLTGSAVGAGDLNFDVLTATGTVSGAQNAIELVGLTGNDLGIGTLTLNNGGGGDGINIRTATSTNVNIGTASINGFVGNGIELNGHTGTFALNDGTIGNTNDPGQEAVLISGGTGAVTIAASVTKTTAGNVVEIQNHTTGIIEFSGAISATGAVDNGILINGSSGTINFTNGSKVLNTGTSNALTITNNSANISLINGGLDIDTTSGFGIAAGTSSAATGGSLTITGTNNTLLATTGHAILMNGTDIGAGGITLQSVGSSGGNFAGIWLKDTGTSAGGFTVTGVASNAGSGGVIANKGGADNDLDEGIGVYLENVSNVSLSNMTINGTFSNFGIRGSGVNNFTLRDSLLNGTYGTNIGLQEDAIRFGTQSNASNGLTGTALFEGNTIQGGAWDNLAIFNNAPGSLNLTIRDNATSGDQAVFEDNGLTGNDGVLVEVSGAGASATTLINGVFFGGARGDHFQSSTQGSATSNVTLTNNSFINNHPDITSGGGGIAISGGSNPSNYNITYNITGNTFRGSEGAEIFISMVGTSGTVNGVIANNIIGTDNASNPQSDGTGTIAGGNGDAIFIKQEKFAGAGTLNHAVRIEGNQIRDFDASGIRIWSNNQGSGTGRVEATILNNIIEEVGATTFGGINALAGGTGAGDIGLLGLTITGNTINLNNSSGLDGDNNAIVVDQVGPNAIIYVPGVGGPEPNRGEARPPAGGTASAELSALWNATNTLTNGEFVNQPAFKVDAQLVWQLRNDPFVLAVPSLAATAPADDWESAARQAREDWLAQQGSDAGEEAGSGGIGGDTFGDDTRSDGKTPATDPQPAHPVIVDDGVLSRAELDYLVEAAIQRWIEAGATAEQVAAMRATAVGVADMTGLYLGSSAPGTILVDADAAGHGWFLDRTPGEDSEFEGSGSRLTADAGGAAEGRMDLLTVLMHELGHQAGLDDIYSPDQVEELMYGYAYVGERRLPEKDDLAAADLSHAGHESYALAPVTIGTLPRGHAVQVVFNSTVNSFSNQVIPGFNNTSAVTYDGGSATSGAEALVVDSLTLGNLVFRDVNDNGVFDAGDAGIDGVALSLFVDANNNGQLDSGEDASAIATTTTAGGGAYSFAGLAPGNYIVRVDAANFTGGGALVDFTSAAGATDPDDNVDGDDNGVDTPFNGAIVSQTIRLDYNQEPTPGTGNDTNNTLDLGFSNTNDEPTISATGVNPTFVEGGAAVDLFSSVNVSAVEPSQTITSLTLTVSNVTGGALEILRLDNTDIALTNGNALATAGGNALQVAVSVSGTTATVSVTKPAGVAPATLASLLDAMTYQHLGDAPADGDRVVTITQLVDSGPNTAPSDNTATVSIASTVDVDPVNDPPVVSTNAAASYTENAAAVVLDPAVQLQDPDNATLASVTIQITSGYQAGTDVLALTGSFGTISGSFDAGTGTLTLTSSGSATPAEFQSAMRAVTFQALGENPASGSRTITWIANDGTDNSASDTSTVNVTAVNDDPAGADDSATIPINGSYTFSASDFNFSDVDGTFAGVVIASLATNGTLLFNGAPVAAPGLFVTAAQIAAGDLDFLADPGESGTPYATFTFQVRDSGGATDGSANTFTFNVTNAAAPVVDLNGATAGIDSAASYTEGAPATVLASGAVVTDADTATLSSATVAITGGFLTGFDVLTVNGAPSGSFLGISFSFDPGTGVLTLTGVAPVADYQTALRAVGFLTTSGSPGTSRTISWTVNDGALNSSTAQTSLTITDFDDPPVAQDDAFTTDESTAIVAGNLFANNGSGADSDPDGPALSVSAVNGSAGNVGGQIVLASGALLTVSSSGTFDYDPNGAFDSTPAPGSGASNQPATDSFTYTLAGGGTATVTMTINGLDTGDNLLGTAGDDDLSGGVGNDLLDGLGGNDTLRGGTGDDWFIIRQTLDRVVENSGEGNADEVFAQVSWTLTSGAEVEYLSTSDAALTNPVNLTGNELTQYIEGNAGNNILDGNGGRDILIGNAGDDWFVIRNVSDLVLENAAGGNDRVFAYVDWTLNPGQHVEVLSSFNQTITDAIDLTGNELSQTIYGTEGANILDGNGGGDVMIGFGGDDFFVVREASDLVFEDTGGGAADRVFAYADWTLNAGSAVEILSTFNQTLTDAIDLTGNALSQTLYGNAGSNILDGGGGGDVMIGDAGDDQFIVRHASDRAYEELGGGSDRVFARVDWTLNGTSHVEIVSTYDEASTDAIDLTGNELAQTILGNAGNNILDGDAGADVLDGKLGADVLEGGAGADTFAFTTALGGDNIDTILDFVTGTDKIAFAGVTPAQLAAGAFRTGTSAQDADDRIIYDPTTGALYYDGDGNGAGAAVQFATLEGAPALSASDFTMI